MSVSHGTDTVLSYSCGSSAESVAKNSTHAAVVCGSCCGAKKKASFSNVARKEEKIENKLADARTRWKVEEIPNNLQRESPGTPWQAKELGEEELQKSLPGCARVFITLKARHRSDRVRTISPTRRFIRSHSCEIWRETEREGARGIRWGNEANIVFRLVRAGHCRVGGACVLHLRVRSGRGSEVDPLFRVSVRTCSPRLGQVPVLR